MKVYPSREDNSFKNDLVSSLSSLKERFLYSGNILSFTELFNQKLEFFDNKNIVTNITLMYPYSLFSKDRMVAERQRSLNYPDKRLSCGGTFNLEQPHWIKSSLTKTLQKLLGDLNISPKVIKLTCLNPLCSVLILDNYAFLTPYHYGRTGTDAECTARVMPVIKFEANDSVFEVLSNHAKYIFDHSTSFDLSSCVKNIHEPENLLIKKPNEISLPKAKIDMSKNGKWLDYNWQMDQIIKTYCSVTNTEIHRSVFISHPSEKLNEAKDIKKYILENYYSEVELIMDKNLVGSNLSQELSKAMNRCSHAIVLALKDKKNSNDYPKANVIHEIGYCHGKMGAENVLLLKYKGTSLPANINGVIYDSFGEKFNDFKKISDFLESRSFVKR